MATSLSEQEYREMLREVCRKIDAFLFGENDGNSKAQLEALSEQAHSHGESIASIPLSEDARQ